MRHAPNESGQLDKPRRRRVITCPQSCPCLDFICLTSSFARLRYADSARLQKRAKPFGAVGLQLFIAIADEPNASMSEARYHQTYTKNPIDVEFSSAHEGKFATYFARWVSARGETGPWSQPQSSPVPA